MAKISLGVLSLWVLNDRSGQRERSKVWNSELFLCRPQLSPFLLDVHSDDFKGGDVVFLPLSLFYKGEKQTNLIINTKEVEG